jgi:hypothetical protein
MNNSADNFARYLSSQTETKWRWAERENADARWQLAKMRENAAMLLSQHEPLHGTGIDRNVIGALFSFLAHSDVGRLNRELTDIKESSP